MKRVALLHGAGYAGRELIRLLHTHPEIQLAAVTSRTFAGEPVWTAHADLRGTVSLLFSEPGQLDLSTLDGVLIAAEHGRGVHAVRDLLQQGFDGAIVDLSADFRLQDQDAYVHWYDFEHPAPELLPAFSYGLTEINAPYPAPRIANPGCFATGIALALRPLEDAFETYHAAVTAVTGASGSGTRPKKTTHFPTRDGNIRAYKVLQHQHLPEILQVLRPGITISLVPVSGPWTRGIWGTIHIDGTGCDSSVDISQLYESWYGAASLVRLWPSQLPELRYAVNTPFCDIGWIQHDDRLVIGFALDNLLKGAASQAIQNLNSAFGLAPAAGLLPGPS